MHIYIDDFVVIEEPALVEDIVLSSDDDSDEGLALVCRALIRQDWLDANENASLECMLDELEARGYDMASLYPEEY